MGSGLGWMPPPEPPRSKPTGGGVEGHCPAQNRPSYMGGPSHKIGKMPEHATKDLISLLLCPDRRRVACFEGRSLGRASGNHLAIFLFPVRQVLNLPTLPFVQSPPLKGEESLHG